MFCNENLSAFHEAIAPLIHESDVQSMQFFSQHADGISRLDHCLYVAYLSFLFCRRYHLDARSAARAGLMHDMDLRSEEEVGRLRHLLSHSKMALERASRYGLNDIERDIILKHMWPVTLRLMPKYKESFVVNFADKICAFFEITRLYKLLRVSRSLSYTGLLRKLDLGQLSTPSTLAA